MASDPLAADLLDDLDGLSLTDIRERRSACQARETQLSYVRRLVQGHLDIVTYEVDRRAAGGPEEDVVEALTKALADHLVAPGNGHLPVTLEPGELDPVLVQRLEAVAPTSLLSDPTAMTDEQLSTATAALAAFEREVSTLRRAMFDRIDTFQAEIVRRYQTGEASVDTLIPGP